MPARPPAADFVGRHAELAIFERAIADARNGLPSVVLVSGDAGIGKTTIVSESAARAGVALHLGRSTHIGAEIIPLAPLADLLRQLRGSRPDLLSETPALSALRDWFTPRSASSALDLASHGGLFVAVLELFSHLAADAAVVVGFEDLHWADAVTWDLFDYLVRNLIDERVVLVGTFRANEVASRRSGDAWPNSPGCRRHVACTSKGWSATISPSACRRGSVRRRRARSSTRSPRGAAGIRSSPVSSWLHTCRATPSRSCCPT